MTFPAMIIQIFVKDIANQTGFLAGLYKFSIATSTSNVGIGDIHLQMQLVYLLLIIGFTFFYTYATFNPAEVSNNIKKNGGFIPGIRAGKPTTQYLSSIISKLNMVWWIFLSSNSNITNAFKIHKSKYCIWWYININCCRCSSRNSTTTRISISNETL